MELSLRKERFVGFDDPAGKDLVSKFMQIAGDYITTLNSQGNLWSWDLSLPVRTTTYRLWTENQRLATSTLSIPSINQSSRYSYREIHAFGDNNYSRAIDRWVRHNL